LYEDRTQNYDEEYMIHPFPFLSLPHYLLPCVDYSIILKGSNILL